MLLPKSKGQKKKKAEEGRWIKIKQQTKEKTTFERRCNERISWDKNFFPLFIFLTSKCKIPYRSLIKKIKSYFYKYHSIFLLHSTLHFNNKFTQYFKIIQHLNNVLQGNNFMWNFNMIIQVYYILLWTAFKSTAHSV